MVMQNVQSVRKLPRDLWTKTSAWNTTCPHCKNKIILHVDDIAAGGVTSPGSQSVEGQSTSKPKDTPEKLAEQPSNQLQISRLLDRLKEETKADLVTGGADIALWCLLTGWKDRIPPLDADFQQWPQKP